MKVKNRRAAAKVGPEQQAGNNGEYTERQMIETNHGGKRKRNVEATRSAKPSKHSTSSHLANGTIDSGSARRKRNVNQASNSCSTVFKPSSSNLSNSCSSSSSTASGPAETVDPYEFAVKTEEEQGECSSTCVVPPMKRIKLDRVEERCFPDSAQSSPLPQPAFSHPSPDANSSPLVAHCTRPLSVLTDFSSSSSSINRSNSDADGGGHRNSGPCNPGLETTLSRQPSGQGTTDCLVSAPSAGMTKTKNSSSHGAETPSTVPATDSAAGCRSRSPGFTLTSHALEKPLTHTDLSTPCPAAPSPVGHPSCSIACSTPTLRQQRCVGVNTMLDTCKATLTEPDLLGPCEPGTTICLNGIVWLETTTGVLVVNVTWRGRTYIGTLLDATQHDFAPPCPRDYVPPFKSSVRSSNRNKRRNVVAMNYKQHSSLNGSAIHTPDSSSKNSSVANTTTPRNRLRGGRTTRSPSLSINATTELNGPGGKGTAVPQSVVDGDDKPSTTDKTNNEIKSGPDAEEEEEHRLPPLSDEEMVLDPSSRRPSEKVGTKIKRGSSTSSSDCPSESLHDPVERLTDEGGTRVRESEQSFSSNVRTPRIPHAPKVDEVGTRPDRANEQSRAHDDEDEELQASFPITCPIEGCRKRFTHVTALRFHLNHTRHDGLTSNTNASCNGVRDRLSQKTDLTQNPESRPPSISPPCPVSPTLCSPSIMPPPRPQEMSTSTPLQQTTISPSDRRPQLSVDEITGNGGGSRTVIKSQNTPGGHCFSTINGTERAETQFLPTLNEPFKSGNKCHSLSTYSNGNSSFHESTGPPGVATRTVTAHTVTVPHGPVTKSELGNSAKPGSYSSSSKRPSSTVQRDMNTSRARLQVTRTTTISHGCKNDIPGSVSTLSHCPVQSNGKSSAQNKERLDHLAPFVPRVPSNPSNVRSRVESEANFTSHMINSLANIPRDSPLNQTSVANQLFPLPPGVWNFSSIPNYHSNSSSTIEAQRASNLSLPGTGDPLRGSSGLPFSSHSSSNSTSSSVNLSSFLPQQSSANFPQQNYHPHGVSNSQGLPVRAEIGQPTGGDQVTDPSQLYGLPDFLVAAAMNALGSNFSASAAAAAAEALRSYSSSQNPASASKFPVPPISLPLPPQLGPPQVTGAPLGAFPSSVMAGQSMKPPNLSNSSLSQLPSSLMPMMGGAAPPVLAPSLLHNFGLTPSASAGSGSGGADRLDPLKFSAAYLMQQAASGCSTFGHPST